MTVAKTRFMKEFDVSKFREFRASFENINPDRPVETSSITYLETDQRFRAFFDPANASKDAFVNEVLPEMGLFLHGPFPLPGERVTRSAWDCRYKLQSYDAVGVTSQLAGARVLDVGCNAGYDVFLMHALGATEVVGLEPWGFYHQAQFLNAVYERPGVSFHNLGWEDLDPRFFKDFDVVNCQGLAYHVKEPMLLLEKLSRIMRSGATLVMETHVLSESSMQSQFIENAFWGDETYWWIHGDECFKAMLRASGFKDVRMPYKADCHSRNPADPKITVEGHAAGARAWFVATKV